MSMTWRYPVLDAEKLQCPVCGWMRDVVWEEGTCDEPDVVVMSVGGVWCRNAKRHGEPDREPQPEDGPDYHAAHSAWERRR